MLVEVTGNNTDKPKLAADYIDYMGAWRLYDPKYPEWTVAYIDDDEYQRMNKDRDNE